MKVIDWREIALDGGLLREPESDEARLIVWVPAESEGDYRYWERIGNVVRGEVVVEDGLASTPATSIRARRRVRGLFGKLRDRFGEGRAAIVRDPRRRVGRTVRRAFGRLPAGLAR